jgi:hypothetical protein
MGRPKFFLNLVIISICALAVPLHAQEQFPVGTVIAIVLDRTLDSRNIKPGQRIVARVAQEVPLEGKRVIPVRSKVFAEITEVEDRLGQAKLGLRFNRLELGKTEFAISTQMRALASVMAVDSARTEYSPGSDQYVRSATTTEQIGGDVVYRGAGTVENEIGEVVGKPVYGGVLVTVVNHPDSKCDGMPVSKTPQAVWLFSAHACGVYGISRLQFENGRDAKAGEILFNRINKRDWELTEVNLPAGTAMLLVITGAPH